MKQQRTWKTHLVLSAIVLVGLLVGFAPIGSCAEIEEITFEQKRSVKLFIGSFRKDRSSEKKRRKAFDGLTEAGQTAVDALASELAAELERLGHFTADPALAKFDREVSEHRKTIIELRDDKTVTPERLVQEAVPAIGALNDLYRVHGKKVDRRRRIIATRRAEVDRLATFLAAVESENAAHGLPVTDLLQRINSLKETVLPADQQAKVRTANEKLTKDLTPEEANGIAKINELRFLVGLKPLVVDLKLCQAARDHSKDMVTKDFFDHVSPVPGKTTCDDRARLAGTTANAENIYRGHLSSRVAIQGWFTSPGHFRNLFGPWQYQGLGSYEKYWTQVFRL